MTKAIEIDPSHAKAYSNRGVAYDSQSNFPQGISDYTRAIGINPNYAYAYYNYEFNNKYREIMEKKGLVFTGIHPKENLVEIIELKNHPWFVACQFHPEFKSKPDKSHPLFREFIKASLNYQSV